MKHVGIVAGFLLGATMTTSAAMAQPASLTYVQTLGPSASRAVQQRLHDLGFYSGAANGAWGRESEAALVRFQRSKGLRSTGNLNQVTLAALGLNAVDALELPATTTTTTVGAAPVVMAPQTVVTTTSGAVTPAVVMPVAPASAVVPLGADTIRLVQGRLQQLNFVSTPADGVWGPSTQSGIERLQRARGLPVTGQLNAPTMSAMGLDPGALVQGH